MTASEQILWTGFEGRDAQEVRLDLRPGAVILFARNFDPDPALGPARCKALIDGLQARWGAELPLAVAIDQEGGPVSRLRPWVGETPALRRIWEQEGAEGCEAWGRLWGEGLALLGFNVDFAPVADLWDGNPGTGMGDRCASTDPTQVAMAVGAFLHGLEGRGVRGCLKHFPGLGGTLVDSHKSLPELSDGWRIAQNAKPFIALSHLDRLAMVAHLKLPGTGGLPASLHRGSVAENPWGVQGRFLPDDLEMGGCTDWSWEERVRRCLEAGHEWLLVCQSEAGSRACAQALGALPGSAWAPALERSRAFRRNLPVPKAGPLDGAAFADWILRVKARAATLPVTA
jgi:beta-N-acetylhexosaminidase